MAKNVALSNESFSDVVKRKFGSQNSKPDWREAIGLWKDDKAFDKIREGRKDQALSL